MLLIHSNKSFKPLHQKILMKNKVVAFILTLSIISLLVLAGPANALTASLSIENPQVSQGSTAEFTVSLETSQNEISPDSLLLEITGPLTQSCKFALNGSPISACENIAVQLISNNYGYGYGYGYGPNSLSFKIKLDSSNLVSGNYNATLSSLKSLEQTEIASAQFTILSSSEESCILRAESDSFALEREESQIDFNDVSFHLELHNSQGPGHLMAKVKDSGKKPGVFKYDFQVTEVLLSNNESLILQTEGSWKLKNDEKKEISSLISFDKTTEKVTLISQDFQAENLEVSFRQHC